MLRAAEIVSRTDPRTARRALVLTSLACALVCGAALRCYWVFLIPYNDAPDEFCHLPMVQYLARHGRPPTMENVPREIPVSYPAMCPLGYIPLALPVALAGGEDDMDLSIARLANAVIGVALIVLVFVAIRQLAPAWPEAAAAGAWIVALHPQLVFVSAYVNNDATMLLVVAGLWTAWIRLARAQWHEEGEGEAGNHGERVKNSFAATRPGQSSDMRGWIAIGVLSALAILCKPNAAGVALAGLPIFGVHLHGAWRRGVTRGYLAQPIVGLASALFVLAPWCLWNWGKHRSLLGVETHRAWWKAHTAEAGVRQGYLTADNASDFFSGTWESFWGCFGYATTRLSQLDYQLMTLVFGLAAGAVLGRRKDARLTEGWSNQLSLVAAWWTLLFGAILVWSTHAWHSIHHGMAAQGRYILPAAVPCLAVLSIGVSLLARRGREWIPAGMLIAVFAWLQYSSIAAEQQSNRLPQPDRRVRARLLALVSDVPGTRFATELPLAVIGEGSLTVNPHAARIHSEGNACVRWLPIAADDLGAVEIEQRWLGGLPADGELRLVAADGPAEVLARIPYRDALLGAARYRFDLRRITHGLAGRKVAIEVTPSSQPCLVEWYRVRILESDLRPMRRGGW